MDQIPVCDVKEVNLPPVIGFFNFVCPRPNSRLSWLVNTVENLAAKKPDIFLWKS